MVTLKRCICILLAAAFLLPVLTVSVQGTQTTEETELIFETFSVSPDPGLPENDELFAAYAEQILYGTGIAAYGRDLGSTLTGNAKILYDALLPRLKEVAAGERTSTSFSLGKTVTSSGITYVPEQTVSFAGPAFDDYALSILINALLSDLPYDLYWYDKVTGCSVSLLRNSTNLLYISLKFSVAENYAANDLYTVSPRKARTAITAASNAKEIVTAYAGASDTEKLLGYKSQICRLVSYDYSAAYENDFSGDNDPWQLIHVFDENAKTNVVCEGYSKAFKYLCDLTEFEGDVSCNLAMGTMGAPHMWNIVTLDGANYLADLTNADVDADLSAGGFFLVGGSGTPGAGYLCNNCFYQYDGETLTSWGTGATSILRISPTNYFSTFNCSHKFTDWYSSDTAANTCQRDCRFCPYFETQVLPDAPVLRIKKDVASGKPRISWDAVNDAAYYKIYRATNKNGTWKLLKTTSKTSILNANAVAGTKYYYKAVSVSEDGLVSNDSNIVQRLTVLKRPVVNASNLSSTGKPRITWAVIPDAESYQIWRASKKNGTYKKVGTVSGIKYTDETAQPGKTYYYKVTAVHKNSAANSSDSVAVSRICKLPRPDLTLSLNSAGNPKLRWKKIDGAVEYQVYRATKKTGTYSLIRTTASTNFTNTAVQAGTRYYYKVVAVSSNTKANSDYSVIRNIIP